MKEKNHDRAAGQTQISISIPRWLLQEIDALASEEGRSRSNFVVRELQGLVSRKNNQKKINADPAFSAHADKSRSTPSTLVSKRYPDLTELGEPLPLAAEET